jgi:uncharacterized OsmC-like protein
MVDNHYINVTLDRVAGYKFLVDFEDGRPPLEVDEQPPIGAGEGPNPARLLAAAVGHCLSASMLYCLQKSHVDVESMHTDVRAKVSRNERGRLRVSEIAVELRPELAATDGSRLARCANLFEDYCVVTASVRGGLKVEVAVSPEARPSS